MDLFKCGYLDTVNTFFDKIFVEGSFIDNYSDAVRSFDLLEKNASKGSPYECGVSRASMVIGSLNNNFALGYFSCLKEIDSLEKNGSDRESITDTCIEHIESGSFSDNADIDNGFKYACRKVIENDACAIEIARMGLLNERL